MLKLEPTTLKHFEEFLCRIYGEVNSAEY